MESRLFPTALPLSGLLLLFAAGCTQNLSTDDLAAKVGNPSGIQFFGDRAVYMGDKDGYRYVHVRDLFDNWTWLGECTYKIADSDWPMDHPMRLTCDAAKWKDVEWLNGDAPPGIQQNVDLYVTPSFPVGAPKTQPSTMQSIPDMPGGVWPSSTPATGATPSTTAPATGGATAPSTTPATAGSSQPATQQ